MFNTRISLSLLSILAASAMMAGATFAFFSDVATSTNNQFGASTMDIQLSNDGSTFGNDVTQTFNVPALMPGASRTQTLTFKNNGTTDIAEIAMKLDATAVDAGSNGSDLRNALFVRVFENSVADGTNTSCTGGSEVTAAIDLAVGNNSGTLQMSEFNGDTYDSLNLPILVGGANKTACVMITLDPAATDIYQGDTANAILSFIAHQDTSQ